MAINKIYFKEKQRLPSSLFRVTSVSSSWLFEEGMLTHPWNEMCSLPLHAGVNSSIVGAAQAVLGTFLPFHLAAIASKRQRILDFFLVLFAIQSLHSSEKWLLLQEGASCTD